MTGSACTGTGTDAVSSFLSLSCPSMLPAGSLAGVPGAAAGVADVLAAGVVEAEVDALGANT